MDFETRRGRSLLSAESVVERLHLPFAEARKALPLWRRCFRAARAQAKFASAGRMGPNRTRIADMLRGSPTLPLNPARRLRNPPSRPNDRCKRVLIERRATPTDLEPTAYRAARSGAVGTLRLQSLIYLIKQPYDTTSLFALGQESLIRLKCILDQMAVEYHSRTKTTECFLRYSATIYS